MAHLPHTVPNEKGAVCGKFALFAVYFAAPKDNPQNVSFTKS